MNSNDEIPFTVLTVTLTPEQSDKFIERFSFMPEMSIQEAFQCLFFLWLDNSTVLTTTTPKATLSHLLQMTKKIKALQKELMETKSSYLTPLKTESFLIY